LRGWIGFCHELLSDCLRFGNFARYTFSVTLNCRVTLLTKVTPVFRSDKDELSYADSQEMAIELRREP